MRNGVVAVGDCPSISSISVLGKRPGIMYMGVFAPIGIGQLY